MPYDPNQPRQPAGTTEGGQWVEAARAGAKLKTEKELQLEFAREIIMRKRGAKRELSPELQAYLDSNWINIPMKEGQNQGEWAREKVAEWKADQLVDVWGRGLLDESDRKKLAELFADEDSLLEVRLRYVLDASELDIFSTDLTEWGVTPGGLLPAGYSAAAWTELQIGQGDDPTHWQISITNGHINKPIFWHEIGHTVGIELIEKRIGKRGENELEGDYIDRFAAYMEGDWLK